MAGKLRKLFTNQEILQAGDRKKPWKYLSDLKGVKVSRQTYNYWKKHLDVKKRNGEPYIGTTVLDRDIREGLTLTIPSPNDDLRRFQVKLSSSRILAIPDLHSPYHHRDALAFLSDLKSWLNPTRVICLGDETDGHGLSMHDSDPSLDAAGPELVKAQEFLLKLEELFPVMDIAHSNHGSLVYRRAFKAGIPAAYIKPYRDFLFPGGQGRGWQWMEKIKVKLPDGSLVIFQHQSSGDILANAAHERCSIVEGHEHGVFEIRYRSSSEAIYWAVTSGCLIDKDALAFAYGKLFPKKPILGATVIIDSIPILVPMPLNEQGRYTGKLPGMIFPR